MTNEQLWQRLYKAAIDELDGIQRHKKIEIAHAAIRERVEELSNESNHDANRVQELAGHWQCAGYSANYGGIQVICRSQEPSTHTTERNIMKCMCRDLLKPSWRKRQLECTELLRHVRIVTDPDKLAQLTAEVEKRKLAKKVLAWHTVK